MNTVNDNQSCTVSYNRPAISSRSYGLPKHRKPLQHLLSAAMLLVIAGSLSSCALWEREPVQVVRVPQIPKPVIPRQPQAPKLSIPTMIVITPDDARYYRDVCSEYEEGERQGFDPDEIRADTGLSRNAACNWAIYGFTVQDEISQESNLNEWARYTEALREYSRMLRETIQNLYDLTQDKTKPKDR